MAIIDLSKYKPPKNSHHKRTNGRPEQIDSRSFPPTTLSEIAVWLKSEFKDLKRMLLQSSVSAPDSDKPLDMQAAAKYLGISKSALYKLTSKKELAYFKSRGKNFFDVDDLNRYLRKQRVESTDEIKRIARDGQS